jgi:tripartite-type tricarboxylate transporter receptor subunit TctC
MKPLIALPAITAFVTSVLLGPVLADAAYPDRAIKLIVPWAAGGDTDNIFRPLTPHLRKHLGQEVVIANVSGASGTKGAKEAKDASPDGYTVFAVHDYIHSTYYTGVADVAYTDFEPVCLISSTPSVLTTAAKTPWKDWKALLADAKRRPGEIPAGVTPGATTHFFLALVEKSAGIKFKFVPYDGLAQLMNAVLGGDIDVTSSNLTQKQKVEAGQLKFMAIATEKRNAEMLNVPTFRELGVDVIHEVQRGLMLPKGTPTDVVAKLESVCRQATTEPAFAEAMQKQGTEVRFLDRQAYAKFLKKNDMVNKELANDLGMLKR